MIRLQCAAAPGTARSIRLSPESEPISHVYACNNLTSKSESDSGNSMSGITNFGGGEETEGGSCALTAEDGPLPSISIKPIFEAAFFLPFAIAAIMRMRFGPAVPLSLWHFFRSAGSAATYASGTSISGSNTAVKSAACSHIASAWLPSQEHAKGTFPHVASRVR